MLGRPVAQPDVSCIIPAFNEEGSVKTVVRETAAVLDGLPGCHEIIVVDDASTDRTPAILADLASEVPLLRALRNRQNLGCHPSETIGFDAAQDDVLFFLPADGQISPKELPRLLLQWPQHDLILTHRARRADPLGRQLVGATYNLVLRLVLGVPARDIDSSILISRRLWQCIAGTIGRDSAFIHVEVALQARQLGAKITEMTIKHYPRLTGQAHGLNTRDATRVPIQLMKLWQKLQRSRWQR